jgi:hypothetical protein
MDNMEKLTHPIELSGEELDLVAAGWAKQCGCGGGNGNHSTNNGSFDGNGGGILNGNLDGNLSGNTFVVVI